MIDKLASKPMTWAVLVAAFIVVGVAHGAKAWGLRDADGAGRYVALALAAVSLLMAVAAYHQSQNLRG